MFLFTRINGDGVPIDTGGRKITVRRGVTLERFTRRLGLWHHMDGSFTTGCGRYSGYKTASGNDWNIIFIFR